MKKVLVLAVTLLVALSAVLVTAMPALACEPGQGRWTGGGTIDTAAIIPAGGVRVTHGFEFHNDLDKPNNLEVNWGGDQFHMTELTSARCWWEEGLDPEHPNTPVNEVVGIGVGKYNGVEGYTINFDFTDAGEPGVNDHAVITITAPDGTVVLLVAGYLQHGNHQAHLDKKGNVTTVT